MKKQKQLNLKNLTVKSFVTTVDNEKEVKGGLGALTISLLFVFCSDLPNDSGQFGPACQSQFPNCGHG